MAAGVGVAVITPAATIGLGTPSVETIESLEPGLVPNMNGPQAGGVESDVPVETLEPDPNVTVPPPPAEGGLTPVPPVGSGAGSTPPPTTTTTTPPLTADSRGGTRGQGGGVATRASATHPPVATRAPTTRRAKATQRTGKATRVKPLSRWTIWDVLLYKRFGVLPRGR